MSFINRPKSTLKPSKIMLLSLPIPLDIVQDSILAQFKFGQFLGKTDGSYQAIRSVEDLLIDPKLNEIWQNSNSVNLKQVTCNIQVMWAVGY